MLAHSLLPPSSDLGPPCHPLRQTCADQQDPEVPRCPRAKRRKCRGQAATGQRLAASQGSAAAGTALLAPHLPGSTVYLRPAPGQGHLGTGQTKIQAELGRWNQSTKKHHPSQPGPDQPIVVHTPDRCWAGVCCLAPVQHQELSVCAPPTPHLPGPRAFAFRPPCNAPVGRNKNS